jgi:hypothetical protein
MSRNNGAGGTVFVQSGDGQSLLMKIYCVVFWVAVLSVVGWLVWRSYTNPAVPQPPYEKLGEFLLWHARHYGPNTQPADQMIGQPVWQQEVWSESWHCQVRAAVVAEAASGQQPLVIYHCLLMRADADFKFQILPLGDGSQLELGRISLIQQPPKVILTNNP